MNETSPAPISHRSEILRLMRWLFSWAVVRRFLLILAWAATIIALFYAEENWRGRRAWDKYRKQLEAKGAQLDYASLIPKPVPDEQNFAANPFVQSWFQQKTSFRNRWADAYDRISKEVPGPVKGWTRRPWDLAAWQMASDAIRSNTAFKSGQRFESHKLDRDSRAKAAPAVLELLATNDTNFAILRAFSSRPYSRYPVIYDLDNPWGILIPHLANLGPTGARLQLRACAELAAGQTERAFDDVQLMFYLADSCRDEPFLMSYVSWLARLRVTLQPLWEGLFEHRWSEAQLREFQRHLENYDLLAEMKRPLEGERAAGILTANVLYRQKFRLHDLLGDNANSSGSALADFFCRIAPHGWFYQEQLNYCRLYDGQINGGFDVQARRVFPKILRAHEHDLEKEIAGGWLGKAPSAVLHHRLLASLLLPALVRVPERAAGTQIAIDQAMLACALERYRLAKGEFPEKLESLAPTFVAKIPNDLLSGEAYKYRRLPDGQFVLYSVGWDEKDDGGTPDENVNVGSQQEHHGDWVWQSFPAEGK